MAWQGRVLEDAWLSTFTAPGSFRELQQWDKTVTTIGYHEKGKENMMTFNLFCIYDLTPCGRKLLEFGPFKCKIPLQIYFYFGTFFRFCFKTDKNTNLVKLCGSLAVQGFVGSRAADNMITFSHTRHADCPEDCFCLSISSGSPTQWPCG